MHVGHRGVVRVLVAVVAELDFDGWGESGGELFGGLVSTPDSGKTEEEEAEREVPVRECDWRGVRLSRMTFCGTVGVFARVS